jgi:hypothetical protein
MDCRIDVMHRAQGRLVRVAGRLTDAQVPDLLKVCDSGESVCLDLSELDSASRVAVETLRRLLRSGVQIEGATRFIQLLIEAGRE